MKKIRKTTIEKFKAVVNANITEMETVLIVDYILKNRKDIVHEVENVVNEYEEYSEEAVNDIVDEIYNNNTVSDTIIDIVEQFNPIRTEAINVLIMLVEVSFE